MSSFGSKVLVFLLQRVYTSLLVPEQMGIYDNITTACNFILPIMYLGIAESVIRFGMEDHYKRGDVFSVGIFTVLGGYAVLWLFYPLLSRLEILSGYTWLVYLYCLTSSMRTVITQFIRSTGFVKLFALDGIFTTAMTIAFNLIFLVQFRMGGVGYVLGTVAADGLSALCLFFMMRLYRFVRVRGIDRVTILDMFRYSIPMIPTAVFWWITNLSDHLFLTYLFGKHEVGLYSVANKIPNLIIIVSAFFTQAWQLSAFTEYKSREGERFFSNVFRTYYTFVFLAASALILLIRPFTELMYPKYAEFEVWKISPYLMLAVCFSCLVTFLGAVYNAAKNNLMMSVTTLIGAVVNIGLNALLIPGLKSQGAALATFISYLVVFIIRAVDTRRYINIRMQPMRIAMNLVLLLIQCEIVLSERPYWVLWECVIFVLLVTCNFGYILFLARRLLSMLKARGKAGNPS